MTVNQQVHTVRSASGGSESEAYPPPSNHDWSYQYDPAHPHQATTIGDTLLTYDLNGNTVRECRDHGDPTCTVNHDHLRELFWNEENRLTAVVEGGGRHVTRFLYDAAGERIVKQGRGGDSITIGQFFSLKGKVAATKHVFVGETRLASKLLPPPGWSQGLVPVSAAPSSGNAPAAGNTNGCDPSSYQPQKCPYLPGVEPVSYGYADTTVRPETYYYHPDHLGSTNWVTDQNGKVHEHVEYYPYGEVWRDPRYDADGGPVKDQRFLFSSKELDEETGLYYFGARYFDPKRVRWESTDPFLENYLPTGDKGRDAKLPSMGGVFNDINLGLYTFSHYNPLKLIDPTGEAVFENANKLTEAGNSAVADPKVQPKNGQTHCNEGVGLIEKKGGNTDYQGKSANAIVKKLQDKDYATEVSAQDAVGLAKQGATVIAGAPVEGGGTGTLPLWRPRIWSRDGAGKSLSCSMLVRRMLLKEPARGSTKETSPGTIYETRT